MGAMDDKNMKIAEDLMSFIEKSPSPFHVVSNMEKMLEADGFTALDERRRFDLEKGRNYFIDRNGTALIAFRVPESGFDSFSIVSAHTDSPSFKIKPDPEVTSSGLYTTLNVEGYGGMLMAPWFDRPLSIAGRAIVRCGDGLEARLLDFDEDLVGIVNLAIHQNRKANEGIAYKVQKELLPIFAEGVEKGRFASLVAERLAVEPEQIVDCDLFLYNRMKGSFWGLGKRFFSSPKIDDLGCAYTALRAIVGMEPGRTFPIVALFDNEETGSGTRQGALSDFLRTTLDRIFLSLSFDEELRYMTIASSFMMSADNGHALHPNYPETTDIVNKPRMNGGVLLKYSANQKYTTDADSGSLVRTLCRENGIPLQVFVNNSDIVGGSTLGNLSAQKVGLRTADVGMAQLAMHSPYETAGSDDPGYLLSLFRAFLSR